MSSYLGRERERESAMQSLSGECTAALMLANSLLQRKRMRKGIEEWSQKEKSAEEESPVSLSEFLSGKRERECNAVSQ